MTAPARKLLATGALAALGAGLAGAALAHGDVAPQPVDTAGLPELSEDWLTENPYRAEAAGEDVWKKAIDVGASGYNQNCARCHGIEAIAGGLAPDLRFLEASEFDDEWYVERFRHGYTQGGATKMPGFEGVLSQEAAWAIRTFIETRPDDHAIAERSGELGAIRDDLAAGGDGAAAGARLVEIAAEIETLSGAPIADSIAWRAGNLLTADPNARDKAAEILTIGLSAAQ